MLCRFVREIDDAADRAHTSDEQLEVLRTFAGRFDGAVAAAPQAMVGYIRTMTRASQDALDAGVPGGNASDAVVEAGYQLDTYCGISPRVK